MVRLGQNFLADPNLLDAIVRDAGLEPGDVVLEVGPGEGVLTERLARAASHVHAVEIDRGLEAALAAVAGRPGVELHWADAMRFDFGSLDPAPTAMVANLPYAVATPVILRTIEELPSLGAWTVMVQREIADRLRAAPGSRTYGSPSVVAQLACEVKLVRTVDPAVFSPRPRIESAIVRLRRIGPGADPATRSLVRAAFAHRRKSLARSLEHGRPGTIAAARSALAELGLAEDARAEALSPEQFAALSAKLSMILAPAKLNLCLFLGPRREDGLHELCSLFEPLALADAIEVTEAERDEVICAGVEGENLAGRALAGLRERGWRREPLRIEIEKRIPVAAGLGGGSADAAAVLRLAAGDVAGIEELAAEIGADVPSQLVPSLALVQGAGERVARLPDPVPHAAVLLPGGGGLATGDVFAEADRLGLGRDAARARGARGAPADGGRRRRLAALLRRPAGERPRAGGAQPAARRRRGARRRCARPALRWSR